MNTVEVHFTNAWFSYVDAERSACLQGVRHLCDDARQTRRNMHERLTLFESSLEEFILTLRLVKSRKMTSFTSFDDVIKVHAYLLKSPSVGKNVRTDLVEALVEFVTCAKVSVARQRDTISNLVPHLVRYVHVDAILQLKKRTEEFFKMAEPTYLFVQPKSALPVNLNVMDEPVFGRLLGYLPQLLEQYSSILSGMERVLLEFSNE